MSARPQAKLQLALIQTFVVKTGASTTKNMPQTLDAATGTVSDSVAGDNPHCIALDSQTAGNKVSCVLLAGGAVVPVQVGTAGATAGKFAEVGTTGLIDRTPGGGTVVRYIAGTFAETGVSGDVVGLIVGKCPTVSA